MPFFGNILPTLRSRVELNIRPGSGSGCISRLPLSDRNPDFGLTPR